MISDDAVTFRMVNFAHVSGSIFVCMYDVSLFSAQLVPDSASMDEKFAQKQNGSLAQVCAGALQPRERHGIFIPRLAGQHKVAERNLLAGIHTCSREISLPIYIVLSGKIPTIQFAPD